MSNSFVLSGLISKYSELAGELDIMRQKVRATENDLVHISSTIKIFEPNYPLNTIKAKQNRRPIKGIRQGETKRLILDILREAEGPLSTSEIGETLVKQSQSALGKDDFNRLKQRVINTLRRLYNKGIVQEIITQDPKKKHLWSLAFSEDTQELR